MIEYKTNEAYERDKAKIIDAIIRGVSIKDCYMGAYGLAVDLLRQSKWVGADIEVEYKVCKDYQDDLGGGKR